MRRKIQTFILIKRFSKARIYKKGKIVIKLGVYSQSGIVVYWNIEKCLYLIAHFSTKFGNNEIERPSNLLSKQKVIFRKSVFG